MSPERFLTAQSNVMTRFNHFYLVLVGAALFGCFNENNVDVSSGQTADAATDAGTGQCAPITSATPVPARAQALTNSTIETTQTVYVDDLYNAFATQCGGCHIDVGLGNYQTSRATFADDVNKIWADSIGFPDDRVMPPISVGGKMPDARASDDPANQLQAMLNAWISQGRPRDIFTMDADPAGQTGPYRLDPTLAQALTNIGNCLPDNVLYASDKTTMAAMDTTFANMTYTAPGKGTRQQQIGLPNVLSDTDLTSFDSAELGKTGVLSYAVAYPQWVDPDAAEMRHIRVPLGQSIVFDKTSQGFSIPGGTRFYKTILQRVADWNGQMRWRKVETQLIVSWPNFANAKGSAAVAALFGTYVWNENESQATLVTDPYRDGSAFRDHIVTYISDEAKAATALATNPLNVVYALRNAQALRSYAIPGSRRCMQCHTGSSSKTFVLGFQPLQVARRQLGEGGVIDPLGADELGQLKRFMDYGLITGISSVDDVLPLEQSEGTRSPRNNFELIAQGYLLGNCAHCHNPGGDPSLENPSLSGILDFQPSSTGGIFKFPLDRTSPRIFRAAGGTSPSESMPYITPSLLDVGAMTDYPWPFLAPKCNINTTMVLGRVAGQNYYPIMAPWRGLLYRGVDTPFTYSDDLALIPHMPMNTQSFDCRAPRIIGDWMVSIPAVSTSANGSEYALTQVGGNLCMATDTSVQPYREISHGTLGFASASDVADSRLSTYHNALVAPFVGYIPPTNLNPDPVEPTVPSRYNFCPDTYDIFDPLVLKNPTLQPVPGDSPITDGMQIFMPQDGVPDHAHWVIYDPTLIPGDWAPRRPDWYKVLVYGNVPKPALVNGVSATDAAAKQAAEKKVVDVLQSVTLSPAAAKLSQTAIPMGLWQSKPTCDLSGAQRVSDYEIGSSGTKQYAAAWMQNLARTNQLDSSAAVYAVTPGEAVHDMICSNCHGAKADSSGRQATILSEMTGGTAQVTDLIHGIMVPANRQAIFASAPQGSATVDDWAARYFAWMGMGGTKQTIPSSILAIVANTAVIGSKRPQATAAKDANMLSNAYSLCSYLLPSVLTDLNTFQNSSFTALSQVNMFNFEGGMFESDIYDARTARTNLIFGNGDVLLWEQVCSVDNPPPVRAITAYDWLHTPPKLTVRYVDFYDPKSYPVNSQIVDQRGNVSTGISSANYFPWCIRKPGDANSLAAADAWLASNTSKGQVIPYCPEFDVNGAPYISAGSGWTDTTHLSYDAINQWATRGAINAGLQVFEYMNLLASGDLVPTPAYDQCEQLSANQ